MSETALYRHWDADGDLLYVGVSLSAVQRLAQHRTASPWFTEIASVTIEWFASREEAMAAEREAIVAEQPRYNKAHNAANDNKTRARVGWSVYLVRHRTEMTIDGLVWAKTDSDLWDVVDGAFDPVEYEYAEVTGCGGLLVEDGLGPIAVQREEENEEAPDFVWEKFVASGVLEDDLYEQSRLEWTPFCPADEGCGVIARAMKEVAA